ncbi:MAG: hypothetical protein OIF36_04645, partial [Alphaproteobacteria bacterium]|nr:hypothetical protein [Alphaproteobacteria bacterium]
WFPQYSFYSMIILKMEIPNYDTNTKNKKFKQLYSFMPNDTFRMLICGNSGSGKTNLLFHMLIEPLFYYDKIYLFAKNLEQEKYQNLMKEMNEASNEEAGYKIMEVSNDEILPITHLPYEDNQKIIVFDDYVCEKNQREIVNYFIQGRHKNCSVIYLSQSFYKTPRDIRLNCSHYCIYEFPSARERSMISSELGVEKEQYKKATKKPFAFLYIDKPKKKVKRNFTGEL